MFKSHLCALRTQLNCSQHLHFLFVHTSVFFRASTLFYHRPLLQFWGNDKESVMRLEYLVTYFYLGQRTVINTEWQQKGVFLCLPGFSPVSSHSPNTCTLAWLETPTCLQLWVCEWMVCVPGDDWWPVSCLMTDTYKGHICFLLLLWYFFISDVYILNVQDPIFGTLNKQKNPLQKQQPPIFILF